MDLDGCKSIQDCMGGVIVGSILCLNDQLFFKPNVKLMFDFGALWKVTFAEKDFAKAAVGFLGIFFHSLETAFVYNFLNLLLS